MRNLSCQRNEYSFFLGEGRVYNIFLRGGWFSLANSEIQRDHPQIRRARIVLARSRAEGLELATNRSNVTGG